METNLCGYRRTEKRLGGGSAADVWEAYNPDTHKRVAIKQLRPHLKEKRDLVARFKQEARIMTSLDHPNIVRVENLCVDSLSIVMELVTGGTLGARGQMELEPAWRIFQGVLSGMRAVHAQGMVHRDLKPSNILMTSTGEPKIVDFGIAKILEEEGGTLQGQELLGTPDYMAPEQDPRNGLSAPPDARADVYALAMIFHEMLTGARPVKGVVSAALSADLAKVLGRALSEKPSDRQRDAEALHEDLEHILGGSSTHVELSPLPPKAPEEAPQRRRWRLKLMLVVLLGLGGYLAFEAHEGEVRDWLRVKLGVASEAAQREAAQREAAQREAEAKLVAAESARREAEAKLVAAEIARREAEAQLASAQVQQRAAPPTPVIAPSPPSPTVQGEPDWLKVAREKQAEEEAAAARAAEARRQAEAAAQRAAEARAAREQAFQAQLKAQWAQAKPYIEKGGEPGKIALNGFLKEWENKEFPNSYADEARDLYLNGLVWISLPGGTFQIGSNDSVTLSPFEMTRTEVTVKQYRRCVEAGGCSKPGDTSDSKYCNWGHQDREDHPINCVDWDQAKAFAAWAGGRLPTEAEWEYAARSAGKNIEYPWGNERASCDYAVIDNGGDGCGQDRTWPVCSKPSGHSAQGLCDLSGNVWEWVEDWYGDYPSGDVTDPKGPSKGSARVMRGGSWYYGAGLARAASRLNPHPWNRDLDLGFRLVRTPR